MSAAQRGGRPWARTVARVLARDKGVCHLCGGPGADSADHLRTFAEGGSNDLSNLAAVHHNVEPKCNRVRGNRPIPIARVEIERKIDAVDGGWQW